MDPVFFGWERVNPSWYGPRKNKPVYVVPMGICLFVVVKQRKPTASWRRLWWLGPTYLDGHLGRIWDEIPTTILQCWFATIPSFIAIPQRFTGRGDGRWGKKEKNKKSFLVNASGWYRRLREPISPLSLLNCDQLWQLFSRGWTILLSTITHDLDSRITAKYSKCQTSFYSAGLFPFSLPEMLWDTCISEYLDGHLGQSGTRYRPQFYNVGLLPSLHGTELRVGGINEPRKNDPPRGWSLKGQERKKNDIWIAHQVNHVLTSQFCSYPMIGVQLCSTITGILIFELFLI